MEDWRLVHSGVLEVKIYLIRDPMNIGCFARYTYSGTWTQGKLCSICHQATCELVPPLLIEWEEGSDRVGDFSWGGGTYHCVVTQETRNKLAFLNADIRWGAVRVNPPERKRVRHKRIPFPYNGPPLFFIIPRHRVFIDREQAESVLCPECGEYDGPTLLSNVSLRRIEVGPHRLFRLAENGRANAIFIAEDAAQQFQEANLQNVALIEAGEICD